MKDNRYFLVNCKQKDEEIIGSVFVTGSFQPASGSTLDYRNMVVNVTINELGGSQRQIEFKDGFAGILDYRLEYQELDLLKEMLGL